MKKAFHRWLWRRCTLWLKASRAHVVIDVYLKRQQKKNTQKSLLILAVPPKQKQCRPPEGTGGCFITPSLSPRLWHSSGCNTCPSANMETMKNCPAFCFLPLLGLCSCYDMAFVVLCQSSGCLYPQIRGKKLSLQCMKQLLRLSSDSWKQRTHLHLQTCTKAGLQSVMCLCSYLIRQTNQTEAAHRHTELLM